ncbi:MAG: PQQ-binding-like beta-propeller repeat protein [Mycobacteriales bacterium]
MRNTGDMLSSGPNRPDPAFRWPASLRPSWPRYRRGRADLSRGVLLVLMLALVVAGLLSRRDSVPALSGWRQELVFFTPYLGLLAVLAGLRWGFAAVALACGGSLWVLVVALGGANPRDGLGTGASLSAVLLPMALVAAAVLVPLSPAHGIPARWPHRSALAGLLAGAVLVAVAVPAGRWYGRSRYLDTTTTAAPLPGSPPAPARPGPVRWAARDNVAGLARGVLVESRTTGRWQGVLARDARTGATRWRYLRADWLFTSVQVVDGGRAVLVQAELRRQATLTELDLASGRVRWRHRVPEQAVLETAGPVLLLRTRADMRPVAYGWDTGRQAWRYGPPGCQVDRLAADASLAYVELQCGSGRATRWRGVALDRTGHQVWRTDLPLEDPSDPALRAAVLRGETVQMGDVWMDRRTGAVADPFPAPVSPPAVSVTAGGLVVGAANTEVVAEDTTTGADRWREPAPGPWRDASTPAVADGRVYVAWAYRTEDTTVPSKAGGTVALQVLDTTTGTPVAPLRLATFPGCSHRAGNGDCVRPPLDPTVWAGGGVVVLNDPNHGTLVLT